LPSNSIKSKAQSTASPPLRAPANELEHGEAAVVGDDRLAVDQKRAAG